MSLSLALNNALSGININQNALSVLSQNIANANTAGYSRKIINQSAVYLDGRGSGVSIDDVSRKVDSFLLRSIRLQSASVGRLGTVADYADRTQLLLGSPGSQNSLPNYLGNFFNSLQTLAQTPENSTLRVGAANNGAAIAREIRALAQSLQDMRLQAENDINAAITVVNTNLRDLKALNETITEDTLLGKDLGDLLDRRDIVLRNLAEYMDIDTYEKENNEINVFTTSGVSLLDDSAYQLSYTPISSTASFVGNATLSPINVYRLNDQGQFTGQPVQLVSGGTSSQVVSGLTGGKLRGLIDTRDREIPNLLAQLDNVAANLRDEFNRVHNAGIGFPGANSYTGQRAVNAGNFSNWSGQSRFAILNSDGLPITSPYPDETSGVRPLTLDFSTLDTGNGPGFPSVQGIINEINQYYGPPQNKVVVGNLNNIRLASNIQELPGSPPVFNFDFDLENISGSNADFFVSNITVLDDSGADITSVTQDVPKSNLSATNTYTTTDQSNIVTITTDGAPNVTEGQRIFLSTPPGDVNGIPAASLGGYFVVSNVTPTGYDIAVDFTANATGQASVANQTQTPRYTEVAAGEYGRSTSDGTLAVDLSGNTNSLYYTVSVDVAVDDGNGGFTTSTITYQVDSGQNNLRNRRYSVQSAVGGEVVVPTSNQALARAILVDENGRELPKINGQYTTTQNGFLKIIAGNSEHSMAIDSMDSVELGKPNSTPPVAGTNRGFSHYFELNNFFSPYDNNGDGVTNAALNFFMEQRLIDNPNLISLGTLVQSDAPAEGAPLYTYERNIGDNSVIQQLASISSAVMNFAPAGGIGQTNTTIEGYAASIIGVTAANASSAQSDFTNAQTLMTGFSDRSDSISGVNLDEELANTVIYQNAYTASARLVSIVDELFDSLINSVGR
ncbi:MAG: flagellar hook-associated protein FlgK [Rickettsiales bacterium]